MLEFVSVPDFLYAHLDGVFIFQSEKLDGPLFVKVRECVALGNGDYLLGVQEIEDPEQEDSVKRDRIDYYALSDIRLSLYISKKED